ncbi:MAG TPA: enoyl-CoA hydratase [Bryobacteraceae bacterium]|nr:enoyl-CoA hydratase [Bryobacteraceae bacterium]
MPYQEIIYDVKDRIATITLNRPDKLNAWTATMEREVRAAMGAAEGDENARAIVLTGAGRGFCAGADMSLLRDIASQGLANTSGEHALHNSDNGAHKEGIRPDFQRKYSYFPSILKPVIAAINGPAVGLGFILTLYCDLRFASETARFGTAFARRGLIAEYGLAWMLPRLIGPANALDLLFSARLIDAAEALRMGLVNRVLPQHDFVDAVRAYAAELATQVSPRSLRVIKRQVYEALFLTLEEAFAVSEGEMAESLQCEDFREGVAHFLEKRAPVFTGK